MKAIDLLPLITIWLQVRAAKAYLF